MKKGKKVAGSPDHHGSYGATGSGPFKGPIVQALFAENSGLGIKFKAASKNVVTVEQVVEDSQAARVGGLVSHASQRPPCAHACALRCASK